MSFFYIEMDSNKVDEPMNNQRLPMPPDAGKSDYPPTNKILFLLLYIWTRYIENVIVI